MGQLQRAGQTGALDVAANAGVFQGQVARLLDLMRQLVGNARVVAGGLESADPLNGPFHLYVHPHRGSDRFVGGQYNTHEADATEEEIIAQKLRRISLQQLECGYTKARPFRTINRAIIEAAIITSRSWYTFSDERAHVDCVVIELSANRHIVYNNPGSATANLTSWGDSKDPTIEDLIAFNPPGGGVLAPRGASIVGKILRKTTVRPNWVPAFADEAADYSNRRQLMLVTGTADAFQFTVMDRIGQAESCHLFSALGAASQDELNLFYDKIEATVGAGADLASALLVARSSEYQTPGPINQTEPPSAAWNTVDGASPYPFQVSVRSKWGMGSVFWDGAKMAGLKSMVRANFTNTNQQRDLRCFQVYENGNWVTLANDDAGRAKYYAVNPDNRRYHPARLSYGLLAVRDAYLQDVSIFGIGLARRTRVDSGADVTDSTGNTTFGGLSGEAIGYKSFAFEKDKNWAVSRIQVPLNPSEKLSNIRRIDLGVIASVTSSAITLSNGLAISAESPTVPAVLLAQGYSLANGTRIWVENPNGADWRATLTSSAWSSSTPAVINITGALQQSGTNAAAGSDAVGRRVYVRRVVDTRTLAERRVSLILSNTASDNLPDSDQVLQTDPSRSGGAIARALAGGGEEVLIVTASGTGPAPGAGVLQTSEITIRRGAPNRSYASTTFYRSGTVVRHAGKHWQAKRDLVSVGSAPDPADWHESHHHMASDYNPSDTRANETPIIVFDTDTSDSEDSTTLGINWTTVWTNTGPIRDQYLTGTDYLGVYGFLRALGFTDGQAHAALAPKVGESRQLDPTSATDFPNAPSGGAAAGRGNWAVEFRRPSTLRKTNHTYEWAGWGNYDTALPSVQGNMSDPNQFYSYAVNVAGGNVIFDGTNQDGFRVTPRGLEDIATGATVSPEGLGGQSLDDVQRTDFPNGIQVGATATVQDLVINGQTTYSSQSLAKTTRPGAVELATIAQLTATGSNAPTASTDSALEASPDAVTVQGLNRWALAQRIVRTSTDTLTIFVKAGSSDRNLDSMLDTPPTTAANAIPTLARASEYANAVIGGGNQTAEIRMAPGLYDPASVWQCNVEFVAYNSALTGMLFPSNNAGSSTVENNYFDGSGYGEIVDNEFTRVNFTAFRLELRAGVTATNVNTLGRQQRFTRSWGFRGGFHFLGIPELIKLVSEGRIAQSDFLSFSATLPSSAFTTNTSTNVDTFLAALRLANNRTTIYDSWTTSAVIQAEGLASDRGDIYDIVFGPALPSHKESLGANRAPYIATNGLVRLRFANLYIRGNCVITTAGSGFTNNLPDANNGHYGTQAISATPSGWTWRQFHHTFIAPIPDNTNGVAIDQLGGRTSYKQGGPDSGVAGDRSWYKNVNKYLPNHIHLLDSAGAEPANTNNITHGPFLDQFIHAFGSLSVRRAFLTNFAGSTTPGTLVTEGFVGKFGGNGYNNTKTRGVLLGNNSVFGEERVSRVQLGDEALVAGLVYPARTIFYLAGIAINNIAAVAPLYAESAPVTAGSFVVGRQYQIVTTGTTNFTLVGAVNSTPGTVFIANGAGSGTGTAQPTSFGQPFTVGPSGRRYNIIMETEPNNFSNTGPFGLNAGLVSYATGTSPEFGFTITPNAVL